MIFSVRTNRNGEAYCRVSQFYECALKRAISNRVFKQYISNLMFVPCIIRRSRNNQHNAQICTTALFIYAGSYMFRQQSAIFRELVDPSELREIQIDIVVYLKYITDKNQCVKHLV
jgi:hypothetical protein